MSNKVYDTLKWAALTAFPAFEFFYLTIGKLWGLPCTEQVAGTAAAIGVFLGMLLKVSSVKYNKNNTTTTIE